jgi:hypothetical protein
MAAVIYTLCALTCLACFVLLWRGWRASGHRLLFWSALGFAGFSVNNVLLVIDRLLLPADVTLLTWRLLAAFGGVLLLLFGLIWGDE